MQAIHTATDATTKRNKRQIQGELFDAYVQFALQVEAVPTTVCLWCARDWEDGVSVILLGVSASGGFGSGAQKKQFVHQYSGSLYFSQCDRRVPCRCDDAAGGVHFKGLPFLIKSIYTYTHTHTHTHTHMQVMTHTHTHACVVRVLCYNANKHGVCHRMV
jgi:hypothetical protein